MEPNEAPDGVVEANFVRAEYYVEPPVKGASVEAWTAWLDADRQAAIAAKRAFTLSQKYADLPESARPTAMVKVGGVWKQSALVGMTGSAENDSLALDPAVDASQERDLATAHFRHGGRGSTKRSNRAARHKARKARR